MMQYCYLKKQLKCLFYSCCNFSEYQSENFKINIIILSILLIIGLILAIYLFWFKKESYLDTYLDNKNLNNSHISFNLSIFGKNLNMTQMNFLRENRGNLSDRLNTFTYISNIIIIFFNVFLAYLFIAKFCEIINIYNEFNYNSTIIDDSINNDKDILRDDNIIPQKIIDFTIQFLGLIFSYSIFNIDSEFIDHNKKNILIILYFIYNFYDSINIYTSKKVLLYENYLIYAKISIIYLLYKTK